MKPLRTVLIIIIFATLLAKSRSAEGPGNNVPVDVSLESRSAYTNRIKWTVGGFVNYCGDIPKMYKTETTVNHWQGVNDYYSPAVHMEGHYDATMIYTTTSDGDWVCTTYTGEGVYSIVDSSGTSGCTNVWTDGCTNEILDSCLPNHPTSYLWTICDNPTPLPPSITQAVWTNSYIISDTNASISQFGSKTVTRSDEYTTDMLLDPGGFDYPPDWYSGDVAYSTLNDIDTEAELQKCQYRFRVLAAAGKPFTVYYWILFLGDDGTFTYSHERLDGVGTGSVEYYPTNGPIEFLPPSVTANVGGCDLVMGATKWIELDGASGQGGGSPGGSGGGGGTGGSGGPGDPGNPSDPTDGSGGSSGGSCSTCSGGCSDFAPATQLGDNGPSVTFNLGKSDFGKTSGHLEMNAPVPGPQVTSPSTLSYFGNYRQDPNVPELFSIMKTNGVLRQVKTLTGVADIVTNSATSYTITFFQTPNTFSDTAGIYPSPSNPLSSVTIAEVGSTNHIQVTVSNQSISTFDYTWSDADRGWTMSSGGGMRKLTISKDSTGLIRTNTMRDAANNIVFQKVRFYQNLTNGALVETMSITAPSGPALTNRWSYYDNPTTDGTNFGRLKMSIQSSGFWQRYEYDTNGMVLKTVSQFLNAATNAADSLCRVVSYDYTPVTNGYSSELRTEKLLGQEISRRYTLTSGNETRVIECQTPGTTNLAVADNLVTISHYCTNRDFILQTQDVTRPDGTRQIFLYNQYDDYDYWPHTWVDTGVADGTGTNIVDGTREDTGWTPGGHVSVRKTFDLASGIETAHDEFSYDAFGRVSLTRHNDGIYLNTTYACCGLASSQDKDGTETYYDYDALKRQVAATKNGIITTNVLDVTGRLLQTIRIGTDNSQIMLSQSAYDLAGRTVWETNALNGVTSHDYFVASGTLIIITTYPDGGTRLETYNNDGSLQKVQGTATQPVHYVYGVMSDGGIQRAYTAEIKMSSSGTDTLECVTNLIDMLGRNYKTIYAAASAPYPANTSYYNNAGQLARQVDPDGVTTLYQYNNKGELEYTAIDMDTNGVVDFAGTDRITRTVSDVYHDSALDADLLRTRAYAWTTDGATNHVLTSTTLSSTDGLHSWSIAYGLTNQSVTVFPGSGYRYVTNIAPDNSYHVNCSCYGTNVSSTQFDSSGAQLSGALYALDAHGRLAYTSDARNGTTTNWFNNMDQVSSTKTPSPDGSAAGQVTTNFFDKLGRMIATKLPDNTYVTNKFDVTGALTNTFGSRVYPVAYTYDVQGRMKTMKTWKHYSANSGSAITTWNYNPYRGWLDNKRYDDNHGPNYTNTPAGRLKNRLWARGVLTSYTYNNAGDPSTTIYSDTTPGVTNSFDRRGRLISVLNADTTTIRSYDDAGNLLVDSYSGGPLGGVGVTNLYDHFLRRTNVATVGTSTHYTYGEASRLATVSDGTNTATYSYLANSPLVSQISFANTGTVRMVTTKAYDFLNRLTNIHSAVGGSNVVSFAYQYNAANQRTSVTNADASYWVYTYDSLGQVTSGKKYWSDHTPVAGQQFEYNFDDIGNRISTAEGGDNDGNNLRTANYTANSLNQYTSRDVPGFINILGSANSSATVSLWTDQGYWSPTERKGDYFRGELAVNNSTGAVWLTVTNVATLHDGTNPDIVTNTSGKSLLAKTPESFSFDLDGNQLSDGLWTNFWDAENRNLTAGNQSGIPAAAQQKDMWKYMADGRWCECITTIWNGSAYVPSETNRFIWDGQILLAVLNGTNGLNISFIRGLDLSGSTHGAGGAGGVLSASIKTKGSHFFSYDGNGNVALLLSTDGIATAEYGYDPLGNRLSGIGPLAEANPLRFSTQYTVPGTKIVKFLFRDYGTAVGRWATRDPIGTPDGPASYLYVRNRPVGESDYLGLWSKISGGTAANQGVVITAEKDALEVTKAMRDWLPYLVGTTANFREKFPKLFLVSAAGRTAGYNPEEFYYTWYTKTLEGAANIMQEIKAQNTEATIGPCCGEYDVASTSYKSHKIHFCTSFFEDNISSKLRAGIVVHEYSHEVLDTKDMPYFTGADFGLFWPRLPEMAAMWDGYGEKGVKGQLDYLFNHYVRGFAVAKGYLEGNYP